MPRLGVYVAAGPNPIFLRLFLLQLARQTRQPDLIAIYENGHTKSALEFVGRDILQQFGTRLIHRHEHPPANRVKRYCEPLKMLYYHELGVETFLKMDLDDIYYDHYIENMEKSLGDSNWTANKNSGVLLVRPFKGDFKTKAVAQMHHNPVGAAALAIFDRKFAEKYISAMSPQYGNEQTADDDIMAECLDGTNHKLVDGPVDYVYVSHGTNESSAGWQSSGGKIYFDE